ncbi:MAG: hypothetical protein EA388_03150 [Nitriliruptor sp.]|nr:MAG: hypothetical protein EA388_03150 [Nitriliruptor sp.]
MRCDETASSSPSDASAAWLAAYALGLAYSDNSVQQRLIDLRDASQGCPELLRAAHRRLDVADVADRGICDDALHLLDRALADVGPHLAPTPGG